MAAKPKKERDDEAALYQAPPEQFVAERNALAKRLRERGDGTEAARVQKLKKPSVPAWAVNRAASGDTAAARRLLEAGEGLAKAQRGAAGREAARSCAARWMPTGEAVEGLMEEVSRALAEAGHDQPGQPRSSPRDAEGGGDRRASFAPSSSRAASSADREPVGFGSAPAPKAAPKGRAAANNPSREAARRLKEAERSHEAAVKAADRARKRVGKAESALDAAREELEEAEAEERDAANRLRGPNPTPERLIQGPP